MLCEQNPAGTEVTGSYCRGGSMKTPHLLLQNRNRNGIFFFSETCCVYVEKRKESFLNGQASVRAVRAQSFAPSVTSVAVR